MLCKRWVRLSEAIECLLRLEVVEVGLIEEEVVTDSLSEAAVHVFGVSVSVSDVV